jgi:hypothetical protein
MGSDEDTEERVPTVRPELARVPAEQRVDRIRALLERSRPGTYEVIRADLLTLADLTRLELAHRLQPLLQRKLEELPHATYEDKKALVRWANAELRRFGLAFKCPKTGRPGLLLGNPSRVPEVGRFQLEVAGPDGRPLRTVSSAELPRFELTLAELAWPRSHEVDRGGRGRR